MPPPSNPRQLRGDSLEPSGPLPPSVWVNSIHGSIFWATDDPAIVLCRHAAFPGTTNLFMKYWSYFLIKAVAAAVLLLGVRAGIHMGFAAHTAIFRSSQNPFAQD